MTVYVSRKRCELFVTAEVSVVAVWVVTLTVQCDVHL
jgi:hypothetical protein